MSKQITREEWLNRLAKHLNRVLFKGKELEKFRVTCGWPSHRAASASNKVIGQCFDTTVSADGTCEMIISMSIDDPMRVADILAHEMVHGIVGIEAGHGKPFRDLAKSIGLEGKMTATVAGPEFIEKVQPILDKMPAYPHASLNLRGKVKKQGTRMIKCSCPECGYTVRTTAKWLEEATPRCPIHDDEMEIG